ncbi:MAG: sugar porter family MFS transporter [Acidobacteria bacterium]|nr:sugar porter family MFS transporter [Acidobacteriota bacterium]
MHDPIVRPCRSVSLNRYLAKATIVGALGGLLFGFDTAVIAGTTEQLTSVFHLTPWTLGLTVSIGLAGTILGSLTSGVLGQKIGGREALRIMAILYTLSAIGCAFAWNWDALMVARFVGGIGIGGSSVLGPVFFAVSQGSVIWVYISEVFPSRVRSKGQSVGCSSHWIMNAIIAGIFPIIAAKSHALPFVFFAAMMALQFFVVLFIYPETKQKSLEQIQANFGLG